MRYSNFYNSIGSFTESDWVCAKAALMFILVTLLLNLILWGCTYISDSVGKKKEI